MKIRQANKIVLAIYKGRNAYTKRQWEQALARVSQPSGRHSKAYKIEQQFQTWAESMIRMSKQSNMELAC